MSGSKSIHPVLTHTTLQLTMLPLLLLFL